MSEKRHKDLVRRFYDVGSGYYSEVFGEHIHDGYYITGRESREEAQENLVRYLADRAGVSAGDRVLDVGCGIGAGSVWLSRNRGASTVGITISPVQLNMARKMAFERGADCAFFLADADEMSFDEKFDVVWAVAVGSHLANQRGFLGLADRFLKRGGRFVIFDWMLNGRAAARDRSVASVRRGMLLASLHAMPEYLHWFGSLDYNIISAEDITSFTVRTWDDALAVARRPAVWKFFIELGTVEFELAIDFLRALYAIKTAMKGGRLICGAIVAEKA